MAITPVDLTNTFDVWRTKTNQLITLAESTNTAVASAFTKANAVGAGANAFTSTTVAGANTAVGTGANAFATAATTGANNFMIAVQNGSNTAVGAGANAFTSATIAGANAFSSATIAGANTAVGTGANNFMIAVQNGSNTAVGTGANAYSNGTFVKLIAPSQTITGDITIVGNLSFSGNTSFTNVTTIITNDPLIYLANNNLSDIVDIGFIGQFQNATGSNVFTGLYREHADKMYYLFSNYDKTVENNHIGALSNNMTLAVLNADIRTSNLSLAGANLLLTLAGSNTAVGTGANAFTSNTVAGANAFTSATIAGANTAVGTGANNFMIAVQNGSNTAIGTGANAFTSATIAGANTTVGSGANAFTSATIAGANTTVGSGANAFTSATIAGANTAVGTGANNFMIAVQNGSNTAIGTGANAFSSATIAGANTAVGTGANAFATAATAGVGAGANAFTSATIAGANTAVGAGANAFSSATIAGANTAVGAGANNFMIAVQNGSNTAVGAGANAFTSATIAGANTAVGTGANAFTSATIAGANTAVGTGANNFMIAVQNGSNTAVGAGANAFTSATIAGANTAVGTGANTVSIAAFAKANAALANTSGVSFNGNLNFPSGSVGIGTSAPTFNFQVALASDSDNRGIAVTETTYTTNFRAVYINYFGTTATGTTYGISNANLGALRFQNVTNALIGINGSGPLIFATTSLERMRIDADGNMVIGATAGSSKFSVVSATQYTGITLGNGTYNSAELLGYSATNDEGGLTLRQAGVNKIQLLAIGSSFFNGGSVGIGTSAPTSSLHVVGTANITSNLIVQGADVNQAIAAASMPTGIIIEKIWNSTLPVPSGYLRLDGSAYTKTAYSVLSTLIGSPTKIGNYTVLFQNTSLLLSDVHNANGVLFHNGTTSANNANAATANSIVYSRDGGTVWISAAAQGLSAANTLGGVLTHTGELSTTSRVASNGIGTYVITNAQSNGRTYGTLGGLPASGLTTTTPSGNAFIMYATAENLNTWTKFVFAGSGETANHSASGGSFIHAVAFGGTTNIFVALFRGGLENETISCCANFGPEYFNSKVYFSNNGTTLWSSTTSSPANLNINRYETRAAHDWIDVVASANGFIAVRAVDISNWKTGNGNGYSNTVITSADGIVWTDISSTISAAGYDRSGYERVPSFANGRFIIAASTPSYDSSNTTRAILTSTNRTTWTRTVVDTSATSPGPFSGRKIYHNGYIYYTSDTSGNMYYSTDLFNWGIAQSVATEEINIIASANVGNNIYGHGFANGVSASDFTRRMSIGSVNHNTYNVSTQFPLPFTSSNTVITRNPTLVGTSFIKT
jgi:hypothetical protein